MGGRSKCYTRMLMDYCSRERCESMLLLLLPMETGMDLRRSNAYSTVVLLDSKWILGDTVQ